MPFATNRASLVAIGLRGQPDLRMGRRGRSCKGGAPLRAGLYLCAALAAALFPAMAAADDPGDPAMRSADARARDRETIRRLNRAELARVQARDAGYAAGWRAWREGRGPAGDEAGYSRRSADHARARAAYERDRAAYERDLTRWRRAVAACRAGNYDACEG